MSNDNGTKQAAKRALAYGRVSTTQQKEKGYSLESQLDGCQKYADNHGFEIVETITDDCSGTIPMQDRPGGSRLYELVGNGEVDAVILYTDDRTERQEDAAKAGMEYLLFKFFLYDHNVELHYSDSGLDEVTEVGNLFGLLKAQRRAEERLKLKERTHRGRITKAKNGKVPGAGHTPYGYEYHHKDGELALIESEAQVVERMYRLCVVDGLSCLAISRELTQDCILTPGERKGYKKPSHNSTPYIWLASTVKRILRNPVYKGELHYGRTKRVKAKERPNRRIEQGNPDMVVVIDVPPIVSPEVWKLAQDKMDVNSKFVMERIGTKRFYLLRGLVRCECGFAMVGGIGGSGYLYYHCCANDHRLRDIEGKQCFEPFVRCDLLGGIVWNYVLDIMTDKERFEMLLLEAQKTEMDALQPKRARLTAIGAMITDCESEALKLADALKTTPGGIVGAALKKQVDDVNARHAALTKEHARLETELSVEALSNEQVASIMLFRADVIEGMKDPTPEDMRAILEALQVHVMVGKGIARITCRIPIPERAEILRPSC